MAVKWFERVLDWVFWGLSGLPLISLLLGGSFVLRARLTATRLPYDTAFDWDGWHAVTVELSLILAILSILVFPIITLLNWKRVGHPDTLHWLGVFIYGICWWGAVWFLTTKPWGFSDWFFD